MVGGSLWQGADMSCQTGSPAAHGNPNQQYVVMDYIILVQRTKPIWTPGFRKLPWGRVTGTREQIILGFGFVLPALFTVQVNSSNIALRPWNTDSHLFSLQMISLESAWFIPPEGTVALKIESNGADVVHSLFLMALMFPVQVWWSQTLVFFLKKKKKNIVLR